MTDKIPIIEIYRGVGIHDHQGPERIAAVKADIDRVFDTPADLLRLAKTCGDVSVAPEARLLAAALIHAAMDLAITERRHRPDVNLERIDAQVAGLDSRRWRDPIYFNSLLQPPPPRSGGDPQPVPREAPLNEGER